MAKYIEVKGTTIRKLSADPPAPIEGEIWFNSTSAVLKGYKSIPLAWATGGSLNTKRYSIRGAGTSETSALAFGGTTGFFMNAADRTETESYNGSSWTEVNNLNTARSTVGSLGSQTAALSFCGSSPYRTLNTESWNGTNWTEVNDLGTYGSYRAGSGTQTAGLGFGGFPHTGATESWNGTNWTEVNDLNTARYSHGGAGTQTATLAFGGGDTSGSTGATESWNGTSWTEVNDLNTARSSLGGAGVDNTSAVAFGGRTSSTGTIHGITETWNGTSWTEVNDMSEIRMNGVGAGVTTAALSTGGTNNTQFNLDHILASTEEWSGGISVVEFD